MVPELTSVPTRPERRLPSQRTSAEAAAPDAPYLSRPAAAAFLTHLGLKTATATLAKWATIGGGPAYRLFGSKVVYERASLRAWAEARLSKPLESTAARRNR
jgi:hypothetical protein